MFKTLKMIFRDKKDRNNYCINCKKDLSQTEYNSVRCNNCTKQNIIIHYIGDKGEKFSM